VNSLFAHLCRSILPQDQSNQGGFDAAFLDQIDELPESRVQRESGDTEEVMRIKLFCVPVWVVEHSNISTVVVLVEGEFSPTIIRPLSSKSDIQVIDLQRYE